MKAFTKYLLVSYALSVVITISRAFSKIETLSFVEHVYFLLATGVFVASFAYVGKLFRDFVMPDAMITSGALESFKQKVFWMIGPQVIGGLIGLFATHGLHKTLFIDNAAQAPAYQGQHYQQEEDPAMNAEIDPSTLTDEKN